MHVWDPLLPPPHCRGRNKVGVAEGNGIAFQNHTSHKPQARIMSVIAFDPSRTRPYSLKRDPSARLEFLLSLNDEERKQYQAEFNALQASGVAVEDKTVFHLGVLDGSLRAYLNDDAISFAINNKGDDAASTVKGKGNQLKLLTVRFGIRGWENLRNKKQEVVPFETQSIPLPGIDGGNRQGVSQVAFKAIDPDWYDELAAEIMRTNQTTEEERKN